MERSKEMFLRMRESDFAELPQFVRDRFTHVEVREENEYLNHRDDPHYLALYKARKNATKELQEYLFNKRHKQ